VRVVLFCGGLGLRLGQESSQALPKPMARIGYRPILWHIMRYYAHHGHDDFVLCLGYKANVVKEYFLDYSEAVSNDLVLSGGGREVRLLSSDIASWRITFADTGLHANLGERLAAVRHHLKGEEIFLASYGDCLTDAPLDRSSTTSAGAARWPRSSLCRLATRSISSRRTLAGWSPRCGTRTSRGCGSTAGSSSSARRSSTTSATARSWSSSRSSD